MENYPKNMSDFKNLTPAQKALAIFFAIVMVSVIIGGGLWLFPILTSWVTGATVLLVKTLRFAAVAIPTAWIVWYVINNPFIISVQSSRLSWALTKFFIKMDRLSVMRRRADYLAQKVANALKIKLRLLTRYNLAMKEIGDSKKRIQTNKELGKAALDEGNKKQASLFGFKVKTDMDSVESSEPDAIRLKKNIDFLQEQADNWGFGVETLRYFIERKSVEYENKKAMAEAVGELEAFIKGDTESAKAYDEALRQVDELCASYTAQVDDFEEKTKDLMDGARIQKRMFENQGLAAIEEYRKSGGIKIPDFTAALNEGDSASPLKAGKSSETTDSKYKFS